MNQLKRATPMLTARFLVATNAVKQLLDQIQEIEDDVQTPVNEKLSKLKKIKEEIVKVGTEIDILKNDLTILNTYCVN